MATKIWSGEGEIAPDEAYYTTNEGILKGREYVRKRAKAYLSRWRSRYKREDRKRVVNRCVDDDAWMASRNGMLVIALCRDIESELLDLPFTL